MPFIGASQAPTVSACLVHPPIPSSAHLSTDLNPGCTLESRRPRPNPDPLRRRGEGQIYIF